MTDREFESMLKKQESKEAKRKKRREKKRKKQAKANSIKGKKGNWQDKNDEESKVNSGDEVRVISKSMFIFVFLLIYTFISCILKSKYSNNVIKSKINQFKLSNIVFFLLY
jgi:hypothetical protein